MNVSTWFQFQASALLLLPVVVVLVGRSRRNALLEEIALWIPATMALDVLSCLVATRFFALDVVLVGSRVVWLLAGSVWIARRRRRIEWPELLGWRPFAITLASGTAGFILSASISRDSSIWDRQQHIPLLTMIRGQRLPFLNVFQPATVLHYHFSGDVIAAALQTFSGGRLHASLALALAHDLMFGLVGVCLAAWIAATASRRLWIVPGILAVFLTGPISLFSIGGEGQIDGYSFLNLLSMSYRPYISFACLLLVGVLVAVMVRIDGREIAATTTMICVWLCVTALGIADEPSAVLAGVGLGAAWVVSPDVLHPNRRKGALVLVGLGTSIILFNWLFQASLAPGGPVHAVRIVPWRSPGYAGPPISLLTTKGARALLMDVAPYALIYLAIVGLAIREQTRRRCVVAVFFGAIFLVAVLGLTRIDINGFHIESHRFMTICEVLFPCIGVALLARLPAGVWERMPILAALFFSAICTLYWIEAEGMGPPEEYFTNPVDCRRSTGAHLFDTPQPTYIPRRSWFSFAGCRPVFSPGIINQWTDLYTGGPDAGRSAFATLHQKFVRPNGTLVAACPVADAEDPVCRYARARQSCAPAGADFQLCRLSRPDREALLARFW